MLLYSQCVWSMYSRSAFVAGGFLVAQFVLIDLDPSHCPFMAVIALSASCNEIIKKRKNVSERLFTIIRNSIETNEWHCNGRMQHHCNLLINESVDFNFDQFIHAWINKCWWVLRVSVCSISIDERQSMPLYECRWKECSSTGTIRYFCVCRLRLLCLHSVLNTFCRDVRRGRKYANIEMNMFHLYEFQSLHRS